MNRFEKTHFIPIKYISRFVSILFFTVLMVLFIRGVNSVSETTREKQQESLETALQHSIAQCYAVEGSYPVSVNYLSEHYGLTYDADEFIVDYDYYGSNIYPDVTVIRKSGNKLINN